MKKTLAALCALMLLFSLCACGGADSPKSQNPAANSVEAVLEQQMSGAAPAAETPAPPAAPTAAPRPEADVDLTKLSSTMIYSEVYNMMSDPESYVGKTVRAWGKFALFQGTDESGVVIPEQIYYACLISDATACCQQGLEFILGGDAKYPEDYPNKGSSIVVYGEFQTYMEGDTMYCHLVNAVLE